MLTTRSIWTVKDADVFNIIYCSSIIKNAPFYVRHKLVIEDLCSHESTIYRDIGKFIESTGSNLNERIFKFNGIIGIGVHKTFFDSKITEEYKRKNPLEFHRTPFEGYVNGDVYTTYRDLIEKKDLTNLLQRSGYNTMASCSRVESGDPPTDDNHAIFKQIYDAVSKALGLDQELLIYIAADAISKLDLNHRNELKNQLDLTEVRLITDKNIREG
jgi:hypothetical protein